MKHIAQPPHPAWDIGKLNAMIKTLESGGALPPILVCGEQAYSGSHRIAAWDHCEIEYDIVEISDDDYIKIMVSQNLDPVYDSVYDFEPFLEEAVWLGLAVGAK